MLIATSPFTRIPAQATGTHPQRAPVTPSTTASSPPTPPRPLPSPGTIRSQLSASSRQKRRCCHLLPFLHSLAAQAPPPTRHRRPTHDTHATPASANRQTYETGTTPARPKVPSLSLLTRAGATPVSTRHARTRTSPNTGGVSARSLLVNWESSSWSVGDWAGTVLVDINLSRSAWSIQEARLTSTSPLPCYPTVAPQADLVDRRSVPRRFR